MMGRKVLLAAFCCITLTKTWSDATKVPINSENGVGQATVQRLYRNIPVGVYASASPYAAFSFQIPKLASAPRFTQVGPVKQDSVVVANTHALLKDSYGNKFVDAPQKLAYRTTFPQQYVQLQELPAHLAQPLVSAAPSFQYKQVTPHFFGPPQFKVQSLHAGLPNTATRYAVNQVHAYPGSGIRSLAPSPQHATSQQAPSQQQQHSTNKQVIYADTHAAEQFQNLKNVANLHLEEIPNPHKAIGPAPAVTQANKAQLKTAASTATASKGKKPIFNLVTKPAVPLLDLSLLEPLTFANPLVPQVQHFLPRINSVKYHKLPEVNVNEIKKEKKEMQFIIQNTKSYDSGLIKNKPKINSPKKTQPNPQSENEDEQAPLSPNESPSDVSNEEPEINSYEINSPNYKETYKEMVVSYNKETQSEPAHYNYEKKVEKEPVHYHFVHTSKEPLQVKNVHYENNGQNPKQLIYVNLHQSNENNEKKSDNQSPQKNESEGSSEESGEDEVLPHDGQQNKGEPYNKPQVHHHENPEHREELYYHNPDKLIQHIVYSESPQDYSQVKNIPLENAHFQPIITEYEENIRILPIPKQYAAIKVNPGQHIQHGQVPLKHNAGNQHNQPHDSLRNYHDSHKRPHHQPEQHVHEKPKHVVTKEETPEEENSNNEQDEEVEHDEKSEQDFEKGYKNAAFGFPAYESRDTEKEIYNPDTYGEPQYHTDYDIENSPFQQYQLEGDEFPKSTRSNYKDARDKTKEDYYLDYSVSKPESMAARYRQKEDYFKMFEKRKPHYLRDERENDEKKESAKYTAAPAFDYYGSAYKPKPHYLRDERENDEKKESAKYTAAPAFDYYGSAHKPKQYATQYKEAHQPQRLEYDYSKDAPKDSSGHASRPLQRLKTHTQFVEPQFQYGFEPSALPRLLDSELAAMASNNSPESEKPNSRKKLYKENWYIKKMSTDGRRAAS